jgi:hypothetical protein
MATGGAVAYDFAPAPPGLPGGAINTFQFYVADQETYDDNLFRVPPGIAGVPGAVFPHASQSDAVNTATLGGQGKWALARQEIGFDVRADENRFARNDSLNFVSADAVGTLDWRAGQYLSGQVRTFYDRALASFSETRYAGKDLVTSLEELGSARYQLGPHWAAYGQIRGSYLDHSAPVEQYNDFHMKAGYAGAEYATSVNDTFRFEYRYAYVTFRQNVAQGLGGYDYKEDTGRFQVNYAVTDKTSIDAYVGYLRRNYTVVGVDSYSGIIGSARFTWAASDKTQLEVAAWHDLHSYIDAASNYFVAKGVSLAPTWNATEKVSLTLLGSYEKQNYISSNGNVLALGLRDAAGYMEQATLRYVPRDRWIVDVFFRHAKRQSNQFTFTYDDNLVSGSVTYRFW